MIGCDVLVIGTGAGARMAAIVARSRGAAVLHLPDTDVWGAFATTEIAAIVDGASVVIVPGHIILAQPPIKRPDGGLLPESALARALGAAHAITPQGSFRTITDEDGRTSLRTVWSIPGDTSPRLARAQARLAALLLPLSQTPSPLPVRVGPGVGGRPQRYLEQGIALASPTPNPSLAARGTGSEPPRVRHARAALARALAAEPPEPAPPHLDLSAAALACACEGITVAQVQTAIGNGVRSVPSVKRATRAGMGPCQGRLCAHILHALVGDYAMEPRHVAPRAPIHPVRIGAVMAAGMDADQAPIAAPAYNRWVTIPGPDPAPSAADVLVIGAGVVGLCAALDLAAAGRDVVLIDRAEPGLAASTANAGSLHVQLLPYDFEDGDPGPLGEALALGPQSIALWRELEGRAGQGFGIRTEGGLVLAANGEDLAWLARKAAFERTRGIETAIIGANELAGLAPALSRTYAGAAFNADEGQIDPLRGTMALLRLVRAAGVRIAAGLEVRSLEQDGAAWIANTQAGPIRAAQVLNAAGAHARRIGALAGVDLPVRAVIQQVIATAAAPPMLRHLVAQARLHLSLKQKDAGQIVIGGGWPGRLDPDGATRLLRQSIQGNLHTATQVMPSLADQTMVRAWTGLTVHLDRGPVLSATPARPGLFHAVTANGYTLGPVSGRLISECMLGRGDPPAAFRL